MFQVHDHWAGTVLNWVRLTCKTKPVSFSKYCSNRSAMSIESEHRKSDIFERLLES